MTAVEFCDRTPIENAISSLTTIPDKIIFVGDGKVMKRFMPSFQAFLRQRKLQTLVEHRPILRHKLENIVEVLTDIVNTEEDLVFDLTGGEDLVLVAMGIVYERYKDSGRVRMQRFNVLNGVVTDCDGDGQVIYSGTPELGVEENIGLYGGRVKCDPFGDHTNNWKFGYDFVCDLKTMWRICRKDPGAWNSQMGVLGAALGLAGADGLYVCIDPEALQAKVRKTLKNPLMDERIIGGLCKAGLLQDFFFDESTFAFKFKNEQIKSCLTKSGLVLELMVLQTARETGLYNDALNSVFIDWDGVFHGRNDDKKDTENEIDVVLMRGLVPIFISCKNGAVGDDELYKLDAVANRFGGMYARRILISTDHGKPVHAASHFRQRATDMNIRFVDNVHTLSEEDFVKLIKNL